MPRIIGIDPGSRHTGFGIIDHQGQALTHIAHGVIKTPTADLADRLYCIFSSLQETLHQHRPSEAAIEQVFVKVNVQSALKLGQARGAALTALAAHGLSIAEYAPREIKQAIVGTGSAQKSQIQHMIKLLLKLPESPPEDAADALAIAITHAHTRELKALTKGAISTS